MTFDTENFKFWGHMRLNNNTNGQLKQMPKLPPQNIIETARVCAMPFVSGVWWVVYFGNEKNPFGLYLISNIYRACFHSPVVIYAHWRRRRRLQIFAITRFLRVPIYIYLFIRCSHCCFAFHIVAFIVSLLSLLSLAWYCFAWRSLSTYIYQRKNEKRNPSRSSSWCSVIVTQ